MKKREQIEYPLWKLEIMMDFVFGESCKNEPSLHPNGSITIVSHSTYATLNLSKFDNRNFPLGAMQCKNCIVQYATVYICSICYIPALSRTPHGMPTSFLGKTAFHDMTGDIVGIFM